MDIPAFLAAERLPPSYADTITRLWTPLAAHLAARRRAAGRPVLIAINGTQGSGKSTLCRCLETLLADDGLAVAKLSLDDLYLTRAERRALAATLHPLFATRGVPGTHDLGLANRSITQLLAGRGETAIPRFDKATDDRVPEPQWPRVTAPIDILLFEGWCIGATPQTKSALSVPVNALEAEDDPQMTWREAVNDRLQGDYAALFARRDLLITLRAPDFSVVRDWRRAQEIELHARTGAGMDDRALDRFLQHYERLTRHMLATLADTADIIIDIDRQHTAGAIHHRDRPAATTGQPP